MNSDRDLKPEKKPDPRDSWQPPGGYDPRPYRRGDIAAAQRRRDRQRGRR